MAQTTLNPPATNYMPPNTGDGTEAGDSIKRLVDKLNLMMTELYAAAAAATADAAAPKAPSFTVANAPTAASRGAGAMIYVTNGNAGAACLAISDGTNWKVVALGATISAT